MIKKKHLQEHQESLREGKKKKKKKKNKHKKKKKRSSSSDESDSESDDSEDEKKKEKKLRKVCAMRFYLVGQKREQAINIPDFGLQVSRFTSR